MSTTEQVRKQIVAEFATKPGVEKSKYLVDGHIPTTRYRWVGKIKPGAKLPPLIDIVIQEGYFSIYIDDGKDYVEGYSSEEDEVEWTLDEFKEKISGVICCE